MRKPTPEFYHILLDRYKIKADESLFIDDNYRNILAVLTFVCFLIQLIPVAPPRLLSGLGFVDTGLKYHQSVYGNGNDGISSLLSVDVRGSAHSDGTVQR